MTFVPRSLTWVIVIGAACTPASTDRSVPEVAVESAAPAAAPVPALSASAPAPQTALMTPAAPRNPEDLAWLTELVTALAEQPVSREQVIAYLGHDRGPSPHDAFRRLVAPRSMYLRRIEVYPLPHIHIDVAVDIEFAPNSRPGRSAMEGAIGALGFVPHNPDGQEGTRLSHYHKGPQGTVRVFVELDPDETHIVSVHLDLDR